MTAEGFQPARLPANETNRLQSVKRSGLIGTDNKARFDLYTKLFRHIGQVPVSYTGLIDEARQYFLSENFQGCLTGATEVPRQETICQHALATTKPFIVNDMRVHPTFKDHPLVHDTPPWVFWAGFPLVTPEGYVLGTVCLVDFTPRTLDAAQVELLTGVAADMTLTIQLQTDHQETRAKNCEHLMASLQDQGVTTLATARAFLNLCMGLPVRHDSREALLSLGLAMLQDGALCLSDKGNSVKTGQGLGPSQYKQRAAPIHNEALLSSMLDMMTIEED